MSPRPSPATAEGRALLLRIADWIDSPVFHATPDAAIRARIRPGYNAGAHVLQAFGVRGSCTSSAEGALLAWARAARRTVQREEARAAKLAAQGADAHARPA